MNSRFCVTPEYPNGTYAYFVTIDDNLNPAYPYTPGPYYYGIAEGSGNLGPQSGHHEIPSDCISFSPSTSNLVESYISSSRNILSRIDLNGKEIKDVVNLPTIYFYDDGTFEKKLIIK